MNSTGEMIVWGYSRETATRILGESKMSDKGIGQHNSRVSGTAPIVVEGPRTKETGEKKPALTFAQRVNAMSKHDRKAIRKHLPAEFDELAPKRQRQHFADAIGANDLKAVKAFISCGLDVDGRDVFGSTPLANACRRGQVESWNSC